jgi:hypothetical protein
MRERGEREKREGRKEGVLLSSFEAVGGCDAEM